LSMQTETILTIYVLIGGQIAVYQSDRLVMTGMDTITDSSSNGLNNVSIYVNLTYIPTNETMLCSVECAEGSDTLYWDSATYIRSIRLYNTRNEATSLTNCWTLINDLRVTDAIGYYPWESQPILNNWDSIGRVDITSFTDSSTSLPDKSYLEAEQYYNPTYDVVLYSEQFALSVGDNFNTTGTSAYLYINNYYFGSFDTYYTDIDDAKILVWENLNQWLYTPLVIEIVFNSDDETGTSYIYLNEYDNLDGDDHSGYKFTVESHLTHINGVYDGTYTGTSDLLYQLWYDSTSSGLIPDTTDAQIIMNGNAGVVNTHAFRIKYV